MVKDHSLIQSGIVGDPTASAEFERAHKIEPQLFRVNGTEVPRDITLRPYREGSLRS